MPANLALLDPNDAAFAVPVAMAIPGEVAVLGGLLVATGGGGAVPQMRRLYGDPATLQPGSGPLWFVTSTAPLKAVPMLRRKFICSPDAMPPTLNLDDLAAGRLFANFIEVGGLVRLQGAGIGQNRSVPVFDPSGGGDPKDPLTRGDSSMHMLRSGGAPFRAAGPRQAQIVDTYGPDGFVIRAAAFD